jgi:hypothetical protein
MVMLMNQNTVNYKQEEPSYHESQMDVDYYHECAR